MWEGKFMEKDYTGKTQSGNNVVKKKLQSLWQDKREYKKRVLLAAAPIFTLCYTFLFFGPVEITASAHESLAFTFMEILPVMFIITITSFVSITLLVSLLRGRVFNYMLTGIFTVLLCGYLQGNFWNGHLGALTGDAIDWYNYSAPMFLNLLLWFIVFIIIYLVLFVSKNIWKKGLIFVSAAIFVMQTVALLSICISADSYGSGLKNSNYLSNSELFDYSKENNTIVFLLDRLDYDYIAEVLAESPDYFNELDGFTSYTNAVAETARTKPGANYMLTNCDEYVYKVPQEEYFEKSWESNDKNILRDLSDDGYKVDVYTEISDMFGKGKSMEKYISNMSNTKSELNKGIVSYKLLNLSAYRYVPNALKPYFWTYTDEVNRDAYKEGDKEFSVYEISELNYSDGFSQFNLTDDKYFKFYHFNGSHSPYILNADGTKSEGETNVIEQTKGSFRILFNAFAEMKKLGIYKNASIIITADHGDPVSDYEPVKKATRIGLFFKPPGVENKPLQYSNAPVSFKNIPATIARDSGISYEKYGIPLDEVSEDSDVIRKYYKSVCSDDWVEREVYDYEIKGDASDFNNWVNVNVRPLEYPFY